MNIRYNTEKVDVMLVGKNFFNQPTIELAKALLGKYLVFGNLRGKIVETEAYLYRGDPGCHAARGPTPRNAPMFGPAGRTYVYFIYGMYYCLNVVSGKPGEGEAVLIRALEPVDGIEVMKERRKTAKIENLCNGPGKLTQAFGITKEHNNLCLFSGELRTCTETHRVVESKIRGSPLQIHKNREKPDILVSRRIGLSAGQDLELRFYIAGSRFVSNRTVLTR
jgi:DNA-3-methyladenine glycosylase